MRIALVAGRPSSTNLSLVESAERGRWDILSPSEALSVLRPGDVAIGRLDVLPTLDGIDDGLWALGALDARGVRVLNGPSVLLGTHDKLLTARLLARAGLPHPRTRLFSAGGRPPLRVSDSVVVKPRFGSWGTDVERFEGEAALTAHLRSLHGKPWFQRHGALVQELVSPRGYDLRLIVAAEKVVGAVIRVARDGEWRTNVALGARRIATTPPVEAKELALAAAHAVGADLVGIDLLPTARGGWTILELNGAAEFTTEYSLGRDVFAAARSELEQRALGHERRPLRAVPSLS
jgi:RimK family alpha-L-glutamate ligase